MIASRPRVLHFITHLALGGAERAVFNLIEGLRDRYEFGMFAVEGVEENEVGQSMRRELEQLGVPLFIGTKVPQKFGGMITGGWQARRAIRNFKPDIIHLHTEKPEASYAAMVMMFPSLRHIPLVRTIQNSIYWEPWRKMGRWADRHMANSTIACVSQAAKTAALELRKESGATPYKVDPQIVYNAVIVKAEPRLPQMPDGRPLRILFAGRFENQKGADLLPTIIRDIKLAAGRCCELTIFGSGTHASTLQQLATNPPEGWTIQIHPAVANLNARMLNYDLFLLPSRYEGLALVAIEAALVGLPVIATDGPGVREGFPADYPYIAVAGDAASFSAKLQQAIDEPSAWPAAVESAMAFAKQHFNLEAMCTSFDAIYREALTTA